MIRKTPLIPKLLFTLGLGASLSLGSCSDNDITNGGGQDHNDNDSTLVDPIDKRDALTRLLGAFADVDSLPDAWSTYTVEPTIGIVNDASEPHVRYLVVPNAEEAYRTYCSYIGASSSGEAKNHEWKVDSIGSLKFEVNNQTNLYATLKVNVRQLPALEELRFVPSSAIGSNLFKPEGCYYQFGDVVKQTKDGVVTYYVCVRPCSKDAELRKTHWATLQVADENFKQISDNLILPTKLCSKQDEGARMVQNYFNVLRIADTPSIYYSKDVTGIDKIAKDKEFSNTEALAVHSLWEQENTWSKLKYSSKENYGTDLRDELHSLNELNAFYYGYSSVWWPGKGDYRVYQLNLKSKKGDVGLYDEVVTSTPWVKKKSGVDFYKTNFKNFRNSPQVNDVYIDSYERSQYENYYLVKTQTGAELLGKSGIDPAPKYSLATQKASGNITIEDVITSRYDVAYPFYTMGDKVENSIIFSGEQMCFLSDYCLGNIKTVSYFICADNGEADANLIKSITDKEEAKRMLYQFLTAYRKVTYPATKYPLSYEIASVKKELTETEQNAFYTMLKNLYNQYLKGKILITDNTVTANLGGKCWKLIETDDGDKKKYSVETVENSSNLQPLRILLYEDNSSGREGFTDGKNGTITFNLQGVKARIHLKIAFGEYLTKACGEWDKDIKKED